MGSKVIRNVTKILKATSGRLFGRVTSGTGRAEELTPAQARSLMSVYSTTEVDAIIGGIDGLTSADIDTLAEINAVLTDADLVSQTRTITAGTGLSGGGDLSADRTLSVAFGSTSTTACVGNDARLSDARTPTAHSHTTGEITGFGEAVDDEVASLLVAGTNITITYNDAANTLTIASTASGGSPGGSSGQVQFNSAGSFGGAAAVIYATSSVHMTVTAQAATIIPICVKAAASQSVNIFESQISSGAVRARITAAGDFSNARSVADSECFGEGSSCGTYGTVVGKLAANSSGYGVAVGRSATAGSAAIVVGTLSSAIDDCVAIGYSASAGHARTYVFGRNAASTAANQVLFVDATHLLLTGATAKFSTSTSFEAFQIDRNATAGQTRLLLWDIDKGSLQRVSIGASDSGGTGFKVLRVPN
jgi:hypothetical protein